MSGPKAGMTRLQRSAGLLAAALAAGRLLGGQRLEGKAAMVESAIGKGRVVMFGFRPQYRAQSWATYIPLLNAIYTSAAQPPATAH